MAAEPRACAPFRADHVPARLEHEDEAVARDQVQWRVSQSVILGGVQLLKLRKCLVDAAAQAAEDDDSIEGRGLDGIAERVDRFLEVGRVLVWVP